MDLSENVHLYYGWVFNKNYLKDPIFKISFNEMIQSSRLEEASNLCDSILRDFPVNIDALISMASVLIMQERPKEEVYKYTKRYANILSAILSSGNGFTAKTVFKVINNFEEYEIIGAFFKFKAPDILNQPLTPGGIDRFELIPNEYYKSDKMFFDSSIMSIMQSKGRRKRMGI